VRRHIHIPTPGELVSPESGSALVTIARALGTAQLAAGGRAAYIARQGMRHRPEPMELIPAALPAKVWLTQSEKVLDRAAGVTTDRWTATERLWRPVYDAVPDDGSATVFLHNAPAAAAGLRRIRPGVEGVVYLHNEVTRGWTQRARRRLVQQHRVVCDSRFVAERLLPGAADRAQILALVNGTDVGAPVPDRTDVEPTVLFVGKVSPHKGPDLLVEAARLLFEDGLRFQLRIVGGAVLSARDGLSDFERTLRVRAEPLGEWIRFEPFVDRDHIADVYANATISVVPSNWDEPCSLTLPEGLAAGLACVASDRGGLPEVGGAAPLYFDPADVAGLAAQLRRLLTDDDERQARAKAARARAEEITWDRQLAVLTDWLEAGR
jgi:glycosyltransferase involved in cell wall biosynthesis